MKSILENHPALTREVDQAAEVAGYLRQKGWAKRNGGNITLNTTGYIDSEVGSLSAISEMKQIEKKLPPLKGCYFYCRGAQMRMYDLTCWPMESGSVIRILDDCSSYVITADEPVMSTSELPSHPAAHDYLIGRGSPYRASLRTYPIELIAMTRSKKFMEKNVATNLLWGVIPETRAFYPRGLGMVPHELSSSVKLVDATIEALSDYGVAIWEKHGAFAMDVDTTPAFSQIGVLNKSVLIYTASKNIGLKPGSMNREQMKEMTKAFSLSK